MASRKTKRSGGKSFLGVSPLDPSIHFVLFLVIAFILVVVVAVVMRATAESTRAALMCPNMRANNSAASIEALSRQCPEGVQYVKDKNGCKVWVCKTPMVGGTVPFESGAPTIQGGNTGKNPLFRSN